MTQLGRKSGCTVTCQDRNTYTGGSPRTVVDYDVRQGGCVEKVGESRPSETIGIGCGGGPSDRQPLESMRFAITSKYRPTKFEPSGCL